MSTYIELFLRFKISEQKLHKMDIKTRQALEYFLYPHDYEEPKEWPTDRLFSLKEFKDIGHQESLYTSPIIVRQHKYIPEFKMNYYLLYSSIKTENTEVIQKFLEWLRPYIEGKPNDYIGYYKLEYEDMPCMIHLGEYKENETPVQVILNGKPGKDDEEEVQDLYQNSEDPFEE